MNRRKTQLARCPHCDSTFEVSEQELERAFGAVRCGECMKIFNANFHKLELPQQAEDERTRLDEQDPIPTLHDHYDYQPPVASQVATSENWRDEPASYEPEPGLEPDSKPEPEADLFEPAAFESTAFEPAAFESGAFESGAFESGAFESTAFESGAFEPTQEPGPSPQEELQALFAREEEPEPGLSTREEEQPAYPDPLDQGAEERLTEELLTEMRPDNRKTGKVRKKKHSSKHLPGSGTELLSRLQEWSRNKWVLTASGLVAALLVATALLFTLTSEAPHDLVVRDARLTPSIQAHKMEVHFQLYNRSSSELALPDFHVELLNLSGQVIASQKVPLAEVPGAPDRLAANDEVLLNLEVDRPATFVQSVRVLPLINR